MTRVKIKFRPKLWSLSRTESRFTPAKRDLGTTIALLSNVASVTNMAMRGLTLASKFVLVISIARFLKPAELGLYGLLVVTIGYALYPIGLDFYTYSTREILKTERKSWGKVFRNQAGFILVAYIVILPLFIFIFITGKLPWSLAGWFFVLVILEHIAQELYRILVAISEQLLASILLFLRQGAWALVVVGLMLLEPQTRDLRVILGGWTAGSATACVLAVYRLYWLELGGWKSSIDWQWIWRGIKIAVPLLVASLALRGLTTLDRYWMVSLTNLNVLGAYVLFISIANAMSSFMDAGVSSFIYPNLISAFNKGKCTIFRNEMLKFLLKTILICIVYDLIALLAVKYLLIWLHKPVYIQYHTILPLVLLAMTIYCFGMIPHYGLYAQGRDRQIVIGNIIGVIFFVPVTWLLSLLSPYLAVPVGLCCAFSVILIWKGAAYYLLTKSDYLPDWVVRARTWIY